MPPPPPPSPPSPQPEAAPYFGAPSPPVAPYAPAYAAQVDRISAHAANDGWKFIVGIATAIVVVGIFGAIGMNVMLIAVTAAAVARVLSPTATEDFTLTLMSAGAFTAVFGLMSILTSEVNDIGYRFSFWPSSLFLENLDDFSVVTTLTTVTGAMALLTGVVAVVVCVARQPAR